MGLRQQRPRLGLAPRGNHHPPNLLVGYNKCRVEYSTHSIGGLSEKRLHLRGESRRAARPLKRIYKLFQTSPPCTNARNLLEKRGPIRAVVKKTNSCPPQWATCRPRNCQAEVWVSVRERPFRPAENGPEECLFGEKQPSPGNAHGLRRGLPKGQFHAVLALARRNRES